MSATSTAKETNAAPPASPEIVPPPAYDLFKKQLILASGIIFLLCLITNPVPAHAWLQVLLLTALTTLVGLMSVRLPSGTELVGSPTIPLIFAIAGLFGATAAVLSAVLSAFTAGYISIPKKKRWRLNLYIPSVCSNVVAVGCASLFYALLQLIAFQHEGVRLGHIPNIYACLALPFCTLAALVVSAMTTTTLASRYYSLRWDVLWHENFKWMLSSALFMSPVGLVTAVLYGEIWWLGIGFVLLPVYAMRMAVITHQKTMEAYRHGVELLGRIMQEAHPYTHGHLHRVARWAVQIAEEMRLPAASMHHIGDAAILHDIGKVAVDDRVLNKVGKLTDEDWAMIRRHPTVGADLVTKMSVLGAVGHWIRHHHERPDGQGYPDGLLEENIPVESSIISVVDAFDAMVGGPAKEDQRPYRKSIIPAEALAELRRHAGTQFRADVVETFVTIYEREQALEASGLHAGPASELADDSLWATPPQASTRLSLSGQA